MRKVGYSEHCVFTDAMLSFIFTLFRFLEIISGADVFCKIGFFGNVSFLQIGFLEEKFSGDMRSVGYASVNVESAGSV